MKYIRKSRYSKIPLNGNTWRLLSFDQNHAFGFNINMHIYCKTNEIEGLSITIFYESAKESNEN